MKQGVRAFSVTIACIAFTNRLFNNLWHFGDCIQFVKMLSNINSFEVCVVNLVSDCREQNLLLSGRKYFFEKISYFGFLMFFSHADLYFGRCLLCGIIIILGVPQMYVYYLIVNQSSVLDRRLSFASAIHTQHTIYKYCIIRK